MLTLLLVLIVGYLSPLLWSLLLNCVCFFDVDLGLIILCCLGLCSCCVL